MGNNKRYLFQLLALGTSGLLMIGFQNCSKIAVESKLDSPSTNIDDQGSDDLVLKDFSQKAYLNPKNDKLDIILVIDNSGSMKEDSKKLADRLEGFIQNLSSSSIDWQACITTTDVGATNGKSLKWKTGGSGKVVLNKSDVNLSTVFSDTIDSLFASSGNGDERGVYALRRNLEYISSSGCYREGSLVSTIVLSDEDERSMGADKSYYQFLIDSKQITQSDVTQQFKKLTDVDLPENYIAEFRKQLPYNRLISNSIVIPTGDVGCLNAQLESSVSFYGRVYEELSKTTGGAIGSICSNDYSATLDDFANVIRDAFAKVELDCKPANSVNVDLVSGTAPAWNLSNKTMNISNIVEETELLIKYQCWVKP